MSVCLAPGGLAFQVNNTSSFVRNIRRNVGEIYQECVDGSRVIFMPRESTASSVKTRVRIRVTGRRRYCVERSEHFLFEDNSNNTGMVDSRSRNAGEPPDAHLACRRDDTGCNCPEVEPPPGTGYEEQPVPPKLPVLWRSFAHSLSGATDL